jgi:hypothetical protein
MEDRDWSSVTLIKVISSPHWPKKYDHHHQSALWPQRKCSLPRNTSRAGDGHLGGTDGLMYRRILDDAPKHLNKAAFCGEYRHRPRHFEREFPS